VRYQFIDISIAKGQDGSVEEAVWVGWQVSSKLPRESMNITDSRKSRDQHMWRDEARRRKELLSIFAIDS
tara:strand:- start:833 stop:1042 length:210 start_codon:yes stop_codon:yes gene_type:complete